MPRWVAGGNQAKCFRWLGASAAWVVVTGAAPWLARREGMVAYVGNMLVLVGGLDGQSDVWHSRDDGATWRLALGPVGGSNPYWGTRSNFVLYSFASVLTFAMGETLPWANNYLNDVW